NNYTWGRIGNHNIIIILLIAGKIGTVSATTTAINIINFFPHLRFGLIIGIGTEIPKLADNINIRFGDVIVN
ncbi:hypothetical protein PgNI_06640, partial [Pyricularia grisea]|uniref:Nucleoside phosphorylase domain-containing protein n=1 Tax=Pyricularia grisea TaxID=148305 RepID=A0A6P8B669_PYRGI